MTSRAARILRRRHRRAMLGRGRRRFSVERYGRFDNDFCCITYHEIPREPKR